MSDDLQEISLDTKVRVTGPADAEGLYVLQHEVGLIGQVVLFHPFRPGRRQYIPYGVRFESGAFDWFRIEDLEVVS